MIGLLFPVDDAYWLNDDALPNEYNWYHDDCQPIDIVFFRDK